MLLSAIVAVSQNGVIGHQNQIPWYLPADLKYFQKTTSGHHILMGRNCFESIGRPLPKRTNVVITRNLFFIATGCLIAHSIAEALKIAEANGETEAFIIGGGEIYAQSMRLVDRIYLTEVALTVEGDVFFPDLDLNHWALKSAEVHMADEKNEFDYTFKIFERR